LKNPKIIQELLFGGRSPNFGTKVDLYASHGAVLKLAPNTTWGGDFGGQNLKFGSHFLETGKLWFTYFGIFGKHLVRATK